VTKEDTATKLVSRVAQSVPLEDSTHFRAKQVAEFAKVENTAKVVVIRYTIVIGVPKEDTATKHQSPVAKTVPLVPITHFRAKHQSPVAKMIAMLVPTYLLINLRV
jgi:hypothetical protein